MERTIIHVTSKLVELHRDGCSKVPSDIKELMLDSQSIPGWYRHHNQEDALESARKLR